MSIFSVVLCLKINIQNTEISCPGGMDKDNVIYNDTLFSLKEERYTASCYNVYHYAKAYLIISSTKK